VHTVFWWGDLQEEDHLEDPGVDERIILKSSSRSGMGARAGLIWIRKGSGGGPFEWGNELSSSIKWGNFLTS
jgi:hypothetical protein